LLTTANFVNNSGGSQLLLSVFIFPSFVGFLLL
jgi:hypothetical protein